MSSTLKITYASAPNPTRGRPIHMGGDPKGKNFLYVNGGAVFIRDLKNPINAEMYLDHQYPPTVARYAPSGFYIASADTTGTVRIWDTTQKEHICKLETKALGGPILDMAWSEDSKRIIVGGEGREKYGHVFMMDGGSSVGEISGHAKPILSVDMKQTRPYRIATGGEDLVAWFEGPPFKFKKSLKEHSKFINCVRFSPNGEKVASVGSDFKGFIYDAKEGNLIGELDAAGAHTAGIYGVAWSPDSKQLFTASADKTCKLWDAETRKLIKTFKPNDNAQTEDQQLGCLWQGTEIVSVSLNGNINYWDLNQEKPKRVVHGHNKAVLSVTYDQASKKLYSASYDALVLQWDPSTGENHPFKGKAHGNQVNKIIVHNGKLVSAAKDDSIRITPLDSMDYSNSVSIATESEAVDVAGSKKNGNLLVAVNLTSVLVIKDGKIVHKLPVSYQPSSVSISADDSWVVVGGKDNGVHVYSLSGDQLKESGPAWAGHRGAVTSVEFSPDAKFLVTADANRDIFVWDVAQKKVICDGWQYHTAKVSYVTWSPDNDHVASGSIDGQVIIWSRTNPKNRIQIKDAHRGGVNGITWVDNNNVISCGGDCTLKHYELKF